MTKGDSSPRVSSRLVDGVIVPPMNMELIVADHCNLSCRQCNHASPVMRKWNADPAQVERDLDILAGKYLCDRLRLIGGEPLLHPKLLDIIGIAKASGVGRKLQVTTNGMLLDRLADAGWDLLDEIELSLYQASGLSQERLDELRKKGEAHGTVVNISAYPNFRGTFSVHSAKSAALVEDIWRACKMVQVWACHALRDGRIYRCPQSIYVPSLLGGSLEEEGFVLEDRPGLKDDLLAFLNAPGPLRSCANCVGSSGKQAGNIELPRKAWAADLEAPIEEIVDFALLERAKNEQQIRDDCRTLMRSPSSSKRFVNRLARLLSSRS